MNSEFDYICLVGMLLGVIMILIGCLGDTTRDSVWQREAVEKGHGEYKLVNTNSPIIKFKWK